MSIKEVRNYAGFTLIELMIAVAIVAILAAIAYPSYQDSVRKSRRADAKAALLELAQFMERNYTEANRYNLDTAGNAITLPFNEAPKDGTPKFYDLTLQSVAASSFTLRATPKAGQSGDGWLELDHTGAKRWDKNNNSSFDTGESNWN